jgi:hypothetical protein
VIECFFFRNPGRKTAAQPRRRGAMLFLGLLWAKKKAPNPGDGWALNVYYAARREGCRRCLGTFG